MKSKYPDSLRFVVQVHICYDMPKIRVYTERRKALLKKGLSKMLPILVGFSG